MLHLLILFHLLISTSFPNNKPAELAATAVVSTGLKYALIGISFMVSKEILYELVIVQ